LITEYGEDNIYYQDESGFDEYFHRRYGYSLRGIIIHTQSSGRRYERQSITALLNHNNQIVEQVIYENTANTEVMIAYFKLVLPKLKKKSVIIMDNATFHKSQKLKELFEKHNHKILFLPPYSPELNPIENMWGTIKQNLRGYYDYSKDLRENLSYWVCQYCV
jgi:transposase